MLLALAIWQILPPTSQKEEAGGTAPRVGTIKPLATDPVRSYEAYQQLQERVKHVTYDGIDRSVEGRHAALLALAVRLPAPILAERIGIHQARAAQWVRLAGSTYADYVADRHAS